MTGDTLQSVTAETLRDAFPDDAALAASKAQLEAAKALLAAAKIDLAAAKKRALKSKQQHAQSKARVEEPSKPKSAKQEELPRGIERRGNSLVVYLTHPGGRPERRSMGNVSVKMAVQQRQIWQREIQESKYVKPAPRIERILFKTIADDCYEHAKKTKDHWHSDFSRINLLKDWWGERFADELTKDEIEAKLRQQIADGVWCETTYNEYRVTLVKIFNRAIESAVEEKMQANAAGRDSCCQQLPFNPAAKVHRFKLNNARTRELSFAEEDRLRAAIRELFPAKEPEFDLALHTGLRRGNMYGCTGDKRKFKPPLEWDAVNFDFKVITLTWSKGGPGYNVPLNEVALAALKTLRQRCPDGKGPAIRKPSGIPLSSCRKWFEQCIAKASIENFVWHDLRHTMASRLRRNRVPLEDIADLLGHNLRNITLRYAHADMDRLHGAVATLVRKTETVTKTDTPSVLAISAVKSA